MESSIFSKQQFRHRKGIPDIPQITRTKVPDNWAQEVERLEKVFEGINLPLQPFQLNKWTKIYDLRFCIEADLAIAKANIGKRTFLPYLERVQEIELMLLPEQEREARKAKLLPKPIEPNIQKVKRVKKENKSIRKEKPSIQIPKCDVWDYLSLYDD